MKGLGEWVAMLQELESQSLLQILTVISFITLAINKQKASSGYKMKSR